MIVELNGLPVFVGQGGVEWQSGRRTLVLQHGAGMDRTVWVLLARYFARRGFNLVVPDLPGHGASGGEPLASVELAATHLWQLIDCLHVHHQLPRASVILGGHSMGALVCLDASGLRPDHVEHLLLLGVGYPMIVGQPLLDAAAADEQAAIDMITLYSHSFASQLGHNRMAGISVQNSAMALLERSRPGVLSADLLACHNYAGAQLAAASYLPGKTTILAGEHDRMTPLKASLYLAKQLDAQVTVVPDCGHMLMNEQPEQTLQAIRQVLITS